MKSKGKKGMSKEEMKTKKRNKKEIKEKMGRKEE